MHKKHMKKIIISLVLAACLLPAPEAFARKKKTGHNKQAIELEQDALTVGQAVAVAITDPARQLYGEWTLESMKKKPVVTEERAYIYLDFNAHKVYGNNGCNALNGDFKLNGRNLTFSNMITTSGECYGPSAERTIMRALADTRGFQVTQLYNMEYLHLTNAKGQELMTLRRQNLDFLNGAWQLKELNGDNIMDKNVKVVIDIPMLTINAVTSCNVINGIVHIDPMKHYDVQFEDLQSSHSLCPDIQLETDVLIALEETATCKAINNSEMALLDNKGSMVLRLVKIDLRKDRKQAKQ